MEKSLLVVNRKYVIMEDLESGKLIAIQKSDYDRIIFLTEIYKKSSLIPHTQLVSAIPAVEKDKYDYELAETRPFMVAMNRIQLFAN